MIASLLEATMWPVAIAVVVVAGLVLAKLGRLLRSGGRILAIVALGAGAWLWYRYRPDAERELAKLRIPVVSNQRPSSGH